MIGAGAILAGVAVHDIHWIEWSLLAFSGVVASAGIGLSLKSMVSQVLSRAVGWMVFVPSAIVAFASTVVARSPELVALGLAAATGSALLLARPMLHTKEARERFSPVSFRRWLFASSTASTVAGATLGMIALEAFRWHDHTLQWAAIGTMGASMIASSIGVVRMRAWGMLLGVATSLVAMVTAIALHDGAGLGFALASIPGFMMALPILLAARARAKAKNGEARIRVADDAAATDHPYSHARYRIADDATTSADVETAAHDDLAAPAPAARAARVA